MVPERNQVNRPTLADAGIDKKLSRRAQNLVAVPAEKFEARWGSGAVEQNCEIRAYKSFGLQCRAGTPKTREPPGGSAQCPAPAHRHRDTALAGDLSHRPKGWPPVILLAPGPGGAGQSVTWPGLVERARPRQARPPGRHGGHRAGHVESLTAPYSAATPSWAPWHVRPPPRAPRAV